jgi:ferric-dicitrate binding protein FerR (iron transport regulator)
MPESHSDNLILKFLSGSISPEEHRELLSWGKKSTENQRVLEECQAVWALSNKNPPRPDFKTGEEWRRLALSLEQIEHKETAERKFDYSRFGFLKIAASVAILLLCAWGLYFVSFNDKVIVRESGIEKTHFFLPDSTEIWLNEESTITYDEDFIKDERVVKLNGEAFFDVKRNKDIPFIILADKAKIRVLGTSFNVKSYDHGPTTEVFVVTGKVSLSTVKKGNQAILLHPNEKGLLHKKNNAILLEVEEDRNALAWKSKNLTFKKARLSEVIETVEDYFNIKLTVKNPELLKCRFTSTFNDPDVAEILETLRLSLNLSVTQQGDNYILDGQGC